MKVILLLILFASSFSAYADVLIYKHTTSFAATGLGVTSRLPRTGYMIVNPAAADLVSEVTINSRAREFWISVLDGVNVEVVEGPAGRKYTVMTLLDSWQDTNGFMHVSIVLIKGLNAIQNVGAATPWSVPKVWTSKATYTYPSATGMTILEESIGTMTLDTKLSTVANAAGDDMDDAVNRVRQSLLAAGYVELPGVSTNGPVSNFNTHLNLTAYKSNELFAISPGVTGSVYSLWGQLTQSLAQSFFNLPRTNSIEFGATINQSLRIRDLNPIDQYRHVLISNGQIRIPAWNSSDFAGKQHPGIAFVGTNGTISGFIHEWQDHGGAANTPELIIQGNRNIAIIPGCDNNTANPANVQLGRSGPSHETFTLQYDDWTATGNTNYNDGLSSFAGGLGHGKTLRWGAAVANSSTVYPGIVGFGAGIGQGELRFYSACPSYNGTSYTNSPGSETMRVSTNKVIIFGRLTNTLDIVSGSVRATNSLHGKSVNLGDHAGGWGVTDGIDLANGLANGFLLGGDLNGTTRTDLADKYAYVSMVGKTNSGPKMAMFFAATTEEAGGTGELAIGGGSSVRAPFGRVSIYAGTNSYTANSGTESLRVREASVDLLSSTLAFNSAATIRAGSGSPEGVVTADVGSLYLRSDGGPGTTLYVKESGSGSSTGWAAK